MLTLHRATKAVRCLTYSPDGSLLAAGSDDLTVRLWDLTTGRERDAFRRRNEYGPAVAFSPDGRLLAVVTDRDNTDDGGNQRLILWDLAGHRVAWDPQDRYLVLGVLASRVRSWVDLAFAPDGQVLAAIALPHGSPEVRRFHTGLRTELPALLGPERAALTCLAYAPDGRTIATGGPDGVLRLWDPATGQVSDGPKRDGRIRDLAYSPDGRRLAVAVEAAVLLWDLTARRVRQLPRQAGTVHVVAFSPDGQTVGAGVDDGTVRLWDVASGAARAAFDWQIGPVRSVAFSPDGLTAAAGGASGAVVVWDTEDRYGGW